MTSAVSNDRNEERRRRLLLGPLPSGFLRTNDTVDTIEADRQAALALQHQLGATGPTTAQLTSRLSITIAQAKLAKNYGITRMDPYVRLRVGHCIYETHTDPSGGKNPRWNKVVQCLVPPGVNSIYLEIFDECSFTMDELIAWTHINIPQAVFKGETHEDWYPLNGKQGDGLEGMINLIMSYAQVTAMQAMQPMLVVPSTGLGFATMPVYPAQYAQHYVQPHDIERLQLPQNLQLRQQPLPPSQHPSQHPSQQQLQPQPITEEQVQQIQEMFPSIEKEVIKSILEANGGNNDAAINSLLQMSE